MKRFLSYLLLAAMTLFSAQALYAREQDSTTVQQDSTTVQQDSTTVQQDSTAKKKGKKILKISNAIEKGEKMVGMGIIYTSFDSRNSEILLMATNMTATGNLFRIRPYFAYAYMDNAAVGFRLKYATANLNLDNVNLSLGSEELSTTLKDVKGKYNSFGASVYHRNYFGLDRKGTVGLFCEFELGYAYNRIDTAEGTYNTGSRVDLVFSPGLVLYILPFVSVEFSVGLADITWYSSKSYVNNAVQGNLSRFSGGVRPNLLNFNFGISYMF